MARLYLKKTLTGFVPADEASQEVMRKYKLGEVYRGDVVKPRSYQHHKLCFALLGLTFENQERYTNFNIFRKAVALEAGHTEELIAIDGTVTILPRSLSYDELDEIEFGEVMPRMMTVCANILGGMDLRELEAEVSRYADEHYGRAA
jgi:hypothetical protein